MRTDRAQPDGAEALEGGAGEPTLRDVLDRIRATHGGRFHAPGLSPATLAGVNDILDALDRVAGGVEPDPADWVARNRAARDLWFEVRGAPQTARDAVEAVYMAVRAAANPDPVAAVGQRRRAWELAGGAAATVAGLTDEAKAVTVSDAGPAASRYAPANLVPTAPLPATNEAPTGPLDEPPLLRALCDRIDEALGRIEVGMALPPASAAGGADDVARRLGSFAERLRRIEVEAACQRRIDAALEAEREAFRALLERDFGRHRAALSAEVEKLGAVVGRVHEAVGAPLPGGEIAARAGLTPTQAAAFEQIDSVPGTDESARARVQALLNALSGEPVTKALTDHLKQFLKDRLWGIQCPTCAAPAGPIWNGAAMQFAHTTRPTRGRPRNSATHGGMTVFRDLILVDRPDRRVRKNKLAK